MNDQQESDSALPEGSTQTPRNTAPRALWLGTRRWLHGPSWGQQEMSRSGTPATVASSQNQGRWQPSPSAGHPRGMHCGLLSRSGLGAVPKNHPGVRMQSWCGHGVHGDGPVPDGHSKAVCGTPGRAGFSERGPLFQEKRGPATGTTAPVNRQSPQPPGHPTPREVEHSNGPAKKHVCLKSLRPLLWAAGHSARACPR